MEVDAEDGRIYLPKETRENLGTKFELIERQDKILLIPIPENPLEQLRDEWQDVDKSVEELKQGALETAMENAGR